MWRVECGVWSCGSFAHTAKLWFYGCSPLKSSRSPHKSPLSLNPSQTISKKIAKCDFPPQLLSIISYLLSCTVSSHFTFKTFKSYLPPSLHKITMRRRFFMHIFLYILLFLCTLTGCDAKTEPQSTQPVPLWLREVPAAWASLWRCPGLDSSVLSPPFIPIHLLSSL